jgi:hypothetical protein
MARSSLRSSGSAALVEVEVEAGVGVGEVGGADAGEEGIDGLEEPV